MRSTVHDRRHKASKKSAFNNLTHSVSKSFKNVMNAGKKDDDLFSGNDIQRRGRRGKSLLKTLANLNPLFLLIGAGFCVVVFVMSAIFIASALFGSIPSGRGPYRSYAAAKNKNPLATEGVARREITKLVTEMRAAKDDIEANIYNDWDKRTSELLHTHCLNELPFELDGEAKKTFDAHVSFIFESIIEKEAFVYLPADQTVVTEFGTLNTMDDLATFVTKDVAIKHQACSFVSVLLKMADEDGLMTKQASWDQKGESNDFAKTNDEVWKKNKGLFKGLQVNEAAYSLIAMAIGSSHDIHMAKQMMPNLLNTHCPMIRSFYQTKHAGDHEKKSKALFEVVNSLEDLLTQLHHHGRIHVAKNEIPAFDENGYLVAVDRFSLHKEGKTFEESWVTCSFVDKLVYYHHATIEEQAQTVRTLVDDYDFYAVENLFDMLMLQHCPLTVKTLSAQKLDDEHSDVYQSRFRAELMQLTFQGESYLHVDQPDALVVVNTGAITHRWSDAAKKEGYTQCPIINEFVALTNKKNANSDSDKTKEFNEKMFDPMADSKWWETLHDEKHSHNVEEDAKVLFGYQEKGELYELRRYAMDLLNVYHGKDIAKWNTEQKESIISEALQYLHLLASVDEVAWASSMHAVLDIDNVQLTILNDGDDALESGTKVKSELFTKLFGLALQAEGAPEDVTDKAEIKSYVSYLLKDIAKKDKVDDELRGDLEKDMEKYCGRSIWSRLNSRSRRIMLSKLVNTLQNKKQSFVKPVVDESGIISSEEDAYASHSGSLLKCNFLTELLTQKA